MDTKYLYQKLLQIMGLLGEMGMIELLEHLYDEYLDQSQLE